MKKNKYKILAVILGGLGMLCIAFFFVIMLMDKPIYNVVFNTNGGSIIANVSVTDGEKIEIPTNPLREGYKFKGWMYNNIPYDFNTVVKGDMVLNAIWEEKVVEPIKYSVTLKLGDIIKNVPASSFSELNLEDLGIIAKDGYIIMWYLDGKEFNEEEKLTRDITLEGKYVKIEKYTIKFNSNGGTKVKDQIVKTGEKVEEPTDVVKDGYVLDGWYLNSAKYNFNSKVSKEFTLVAKWVEDSNINWYTVSFDTDGGNEIKSQKIRENMSLAKVDTPVKKNFIFVDWYYKDKAFDMKTKVTEDIELKAIWRVPEKYLVTFQYDDGKEYVKREVLEGEKVTKPDNPSKKDSEFVEWQLDGKKFDFETKISKSITLNAKFETNNKNCTITFNTGTGATTIAPKTIECGGTISKPSDPTKIGYKFIVWQINGLEFDFSSKITSDIILNAIYEEKECTVSFDANGGTDVTSYVVPYGTIINNPPTSTREYHEFVEWRLNDKSFEFATTPITSDITLKAEWVSID